MKNMNNERKEITVKGATFTELLQLTFIVLKLTGVINWSWGWVLAPTWIPICFVLFFAVIAFGFIGAVKLFDFIDSRRFR